MRPNVLMFLLFCTSCGLAAPQVGEPVSEGVGGAQFQARANGTDVVAVRVLFPADQRGQPRPGPHPGVVFVQGGLVPTSRYFWQGEALAREGYVVAFPEHDFNLAITAVENGVAARRLLAAPPPESVLVGLVDSTRIAVAGHSLGAVVAMKLMLGGDFTAAVLEAGFQDSADQSSVSKLQRPTLFLAGAADCNAGSGAVSAAWAQVPSPTALVLLEGVTHYEFTDSAQEDLDAHCTPATGLVEAHRRMLSSLLAFLPAAWARQVNATALGDAVGAEAQTR
jgi:dienelactone hydrolase